MAHTTHTENTLGAHVAALIQQRGYTLREFAEATDIPLVTLHRRLRSQSVRFTYSELARAAAALGTTAGAIITAFEEKAA